MNIIITFKQKRVNAYALKKERKESPDLSKREYEN